MKEKNQWESSKREPRRITRKKKTPKGTADKVFNDDNIDKSKDFLKTDSISSGYMPEKDVEDADEASNSDKDRITSQAPQHPHSIGLLTSEELAEQTKRDRILAAMSILTVVALLAVFLIGLIFGLYYIKAIELPPFIAALFSNGSDGPTPSENGESDGLLPLLKKASPQSGDVHYYEINADDYERLLAETIAYREYNATILVTAKAGEHQLRKKIRVTRSGEKYNAQVFDPSTERLLTTVISDGENVRITDHISYAAPVSSIHKSGGLFTFENQLGIPSVTDFLYRDDIEDLSIIEIRTHEYNALLVRYKYKDIPQIEDIFVSLDNGLVIGAETYVDNMIVYSLSVLDVSTVDQAYISDIFNVYQN